MVFGLITALLLLIILSAFFSGSETAMMSLNRYKLRHLARKKNIKAKRVQQLLSRTDRLLSVVLLGNTFANIFASAITTILAQIWFGEVGVFIATIVLTLFILIFSEIIPKTYAALYPEKIAYPVSWFLMVLLKILYPIAWILNLIAGFIFKLFRISMGKKSHDALTGEELRSVVVESSNSNMINSRHQTMLLGVLDLDHATLLDVMVPRHQVLGIDLNESWDAIFEKLKKSPYSKMPVYQDHLDNLVGILHLRRLIVLMENQPLGLGLKKDMRADLELLIDRPYFVPETTSLQKQLLEFQKNGEHFALVVDEYGDIQGMVTLEDIVEEIVGSMSSQQQNALQQRKISQQTDGSYLLSGSLSLRDINRSLGIQLPTQEAKTLSGLITDHLQSIPTPKTCIRIESYIFEIMEVEDNAIRIVRLTKII